MQYVDIQVNGCFGVDFNSMALTAEDFIQASNQLGETGVAAFLPTLITDSASNLLRKLSKLADFIESYQNPSCCIAGIHLEGPFLSDRSGYIGAHPQQEAIPASIELAEKFLDAARGQLRLVTLAPEQDPGARVTHWLVKQGVRVWAGHTDASLDCMKGCIDAGLTGFTHLGNGCPAMLPRHDNIIHRILSLKELRWVSLIADGHHVPTWLLSNWLEQLGLERTLIVSDSISAAGLGPGKYELSGLQVTLDNDGVPRNSLTGQFMGSSATMASMESKLRGLGYNDQQLRQIMYDNPSSMLR